MAPFFSVVPYGYDNHDPLETWLLKSQTEAEEPTNLDTSSQVFERLVT